AVSRIAAALARAGDIKQAMEVADAITTEYQKGEALKEIVAAQLFSKDPKAAMQTAEAIKTVYWRVVALAEIGKAQAKSGQAAIPGQTFKKTFAETGIEGGEIRDDEPGLGGLRNSALCLVLQAQTEAGQDENALAWVAKQSSPLLRSQALLHIARGFASRK